MKTGAFIALKETRTLFPSTSTCPSTCLSQPTFAEAMVGKQSQQPHQQQQQL